MHAYATTTITHIESYYNSVSFFKYKKVQN